ANVFHLSVTRAEQGEQLLQERFVIRAPHARGRAVHRGAVRYGEHDRHAAARQRAIKITPDDAAALSHGHGPARERGKRRNESARGRGDGLVGLAGQIAACGAEYLRRIGATANERRDGSGLVEEEPLMTPHRLGVAPDLRVDRIGEAQSLVAEFGRNLGLEVVVRAVDVPHSLQKTQREQRVNGGCHLMGWSQSGRHVKVMARGMGFKDSPRPRHPPNWQPASLLASSLGNGQSFPASPPRPWESAIGNGEWWEWGMG